MPDSANKPYDMHDVLRRVIDFVEANVTQPISVRDMAEIADLSVHHFARSFKEASGRTPHQYVTERRLQLAGTMSGGEQAMVSIGRGLMGAPKLPLWDWGLVRWWQRRHESSSWQTAHFWRSQLASSPCVWRSQGMVWLSGFFTRWQSAQ